MSRGSGGVGFQLTDALNVRFGPQRAVISIVLFNTVIGWSFRVCLGAQELEQWYADRRDFLAILPSHETRASRSPCFRL